MGLQTSLDERFTGPITRFEREEARQIQLSLLPAGPLLRSSYEIAYRFSPFAGVGGDFADFFELPDGKVGLYVGDVVGKGLSAALYAALVMGLFRGLHKTGATPSDSLALLNRRMLVRPVTCRYAATLYGVFDPETRKLTFSNAGLPLPLLISACGCIPLGEGGLPSGLMAGATYENHSVQLGPGDTVLLATDGLHELRDREDQDFSWDRLNRIGEQCRDRSAEDTLGFLFEEAGSFAEGGSQQNDDITAVVLKVRS